MPILDNPKHEAFCQGIMQGMADGAAYEAAGYKPHAASASRLRKNAKIVARLDELRAKAEERYQITRDRTLGEYALLGFSNMLDYVTPQEDGTVAVDMSQLTRAQAAAISEVIVETRFERQGEETIPVRKVKFKLADKRGALDSICRIMGWNAPEKHEHTGKDGGPIEVRDDRELARRAAYLLRKAQSGRPEGAGINGDAGDGTPAMGSQSRASN